MAVRKQVGRMVARCFFGGVNCKKRQTTGVINIYNGWCEIFCDPCASGYTAFQCNYIKIPLN